MYISNYIYVLCIMYIMYLKNIYIYLLYNITYKFV